MGMASCLSRFCDMGSQQHRVLPSFASAAKGGEVYLLVKNIPALNEKSRIKNVGSSGTILACARFFLLERASLYANAEAAAVRG